MEGIASGLINVLSEQMPGRTIERHESLQLGQLVFRHRFAQDIPEYKSEALPLEPTWISEYHKSIKLYILETRGKLYILFLCTGNERK
jgi:hypothetical protein